MEGVDAGAEVGVLGAVFLCTNHPSTCATETVITSIIPRLAHTPEPTLVVLTVFLVVVVVVVVGGAGGGAGGVAATLCHSIVVHLGGTPGLAWSPPTVPRVPGASIIGLPLVCEGEDALLAISCVAGR